MRIRGRSKLLDMAGKAFPCIWSAISGSRTCWAAPRSRPDTEKIREYLHGKKVLVTGAGGSIGSEICRQVSSSAGVTHHAWARRKLHFHDPDEAIPRFPDLRSEAVIADV